MTERAETAGMRVLTDDEFGLVTGGATAAQVGLVVAGGVAATALVGPVGAALVVAGELAGYGAAYAVDHAMKK